MSSFHHSDINMVLIDYVCCKLRNIWVLSSKTTPEVITLQELYPLSSIHIIIFPNFSR